MQGVAAAEEPLDPEIRAFVAEMKAGFSQYPPFSHLTFAEARAVAEAVRLQWRQGGPVMASTTERRIGTDAGEVRVRIYRPDRVRTAGLAPALVYLHGGGWTLFSLDTHDRVMREYAQRAGVIVVGVDYALSPEAKFPKALGQTVGAVEWLRAHGDELGIDSARLAVGGDSAGGNLAIATALRLRDGGKKELLRAILLSYAAIDSECSPGAVAQYGGEAFMLTGEEMHQFWVNYLASADQARDPYACPSRADLRGLPPVFLGISECDVLAEQNLAFAGALRAAGVETEAVVYVGATHSFLEAVSIARVADRALQEGSAWLQRKLS
ncbi:MAG: alpha/beta hydrolase [Steroidobacteraceae bacterium]